MPRAARIKRIPQKQIEVMEGQGQVPIRIRRFFVQLMLLEPPARAPEAGTQGELFIGIPQRAEQAEDFIGPRTSGANDAPGGGGYCLARFDALEKHTFELAAVLRTVRVNAAPAAVERSARLRQVRRAQGRMRMADRQAKRPQSRSRIARLQREVGEDDPVAAEPAPGAKLLADCLVGFRSHAQATGKLTP